MSTPTTTPHPEPLPESGGPAGLVVRDWIAVDQAVTRALGAARSPRERTVIHEAVAACGGPDPDQVGGGAVWQQALFAAQARLAPTQAPTSASRDVVQVGADLAIAVGGVLSLSPVQEAQVGGVLADMLTGMNPGEHGTAVAGEEPDALAAYLAELPTSVRIDLNNVTEASLTTAARSAIDGPLPAVGMMVRAFEPEDGVQMLAVVTALSAARITLAPAWTQMIDIA